MSEPRSSNRWPTRQGGRSSAGVRGWHRALLGTNNWIFVILLGMLAIFSITSPGHVFFSTGNVRAIALAACEILLLAVGETFVIITGSIDLSIGSVLVLASTIGVDIMSSINGSVPIGITLLLGVAVTLLIGIAAGAVNGLVTTVFKIPSFIVTLGMLGVALGIAELFTSGSISKTAPNALVTFGISEIVGVPWVVLLSLIVTAVLGLLLHTTRFGLHCYAVGANREGARRAGVHVNTIIVAVFSLMGFLAGLAAIIDLARFSEASVASHQSDNLEAIAGVIIGGASLFGGRGTIWGTFIGTLVPVVLLQGLVIQDVNPYYQNVAIGAILVMAVGIDQYQRQRMARGHIRLAKGGARSEASSREEPLSYALTEKGR